MWGVREAVTSEDGGVRNEGGGNRVYVQVEKENVRREGGVMSEEGGRGDE